MRFGANVAGQPEEHNGGIGAHLRIRVPSPENSGNFQPQLRRSRAYRRTKMKCLLSSGEASVAGGEQKKQDYSPAVYGILTYPKAFRAYQQQRT